MGGALRPIYGFEAASLEGASVRNSGICAHRGKTWSSRRRMCLDFAVKPTSEVSTSLNLHRAERRNWKHPAARDYEYEKSEQMTRTRAGLKLKGCNIHGVGHVKRVIQQLLHVEGRRGGPKIAVGSGRMFTAAVADGVNSSSVICLRRTAVVLLTAWQEALPVETPKAMPEVAMPEGVQLGNGPHVFQPHRVTPITKKQGRVVGAPTGRGRKSELKT